MDEKGNRDKERTSEEYRQEAEEHMDTLKQEWKVFGRTGIFVLAAVVAVIIICLAWFASNRQVSGGGMAIQVAGNDFELAAKKEDNNYQGKFDGENADYGTPSTELDSVTTEVNSYMTTDGSHTSISWALTENSHMQNRISGNAGINPGSNGEITFYIIAKKTGSLTVNLDLELIGLDNTSQEIGSDTTAQQLLEGHILLFAGYNAENKSYSGCISKDAASNDDTNPVSWEMTLGDGTNARLSFSADGKLTWSADVEKDKAYPVTIYWIWPEVLGQYLFRNSNRIDGRPILFSNDKADSNSRDPAALPKDLFVKMCSQADGAISNRYFMWSSDDTEATNLISASVLNGLRSTNFNTITYSDLCSYYNKADQYLGDNVRYVELKLVAQ